MHMSFSDFTTALLLLTAFLFLFKRLRYRSPEKQGAEGEKRIAKMLSKTSFMGYGSRLLQNLYVPSTAGGSSVTSEIDLLYLTQKAWSLLKAKTFRVTFSETTFPRNGPFPCLPGEAGAEKDVPRNTTSITLFGRTATTSRIWSAFWVMISPASPLLCFPIAAPWWISTGMHRAPISVSYMIWLGWCATYQTLIPMSFQPSK